MMDTFASVISNNLNIVMKTLASITIVVSIPTAISSFFGMNIDLPFQHMGYPYAFLTVLGIAIVSSVLTTYVFAKMKLF
jgi:magnesium transporter